MFGTIDTWLLWNLTGGTAGGVHLTDVTNASRTQLVDLQTLDWDDELLAAFDAAACAAAADRAVERQLWRRRRSRRSSGVPISGILGDQQAALVGQTCFEPGEAKNTYGTGCFMLMNTGPQPVPSTAGPHHDGRVSVRRRAAALRARGLDRDRRRARAMAARQLRANREELARSRRSRGKSQDNGDVYFVPAFSGLFAPYWRDTARGVLVGLTRYANRGHIARAALEAVAYQTRDVLEAMEKDSGIPIKELRVDGGMVANELLMQFQADQLGVPVVRPRVTETTALGAAYAAGLAVGYWSSRAELVRNWGVERRWHAGDAGRRARQAVCRLAESRATLVRLGRQARLSPTGERECKVFSVSSSAR